MNLSINTLIVILLGVIVISVVGFLVTDQVIDFRYFALDEIDAVNLVPGGS